MAYVRHGQGGRLARRPGRDRIHVPASRTHGDRTGTCGDALLPHRRWKDLSKAVRRSYERLRQKSGPPRMRCGGSNGTCLDPHALWASPAGRSRIFHRVFRARPHHGGWRVPRRHRVVAYGWNAASVPRADRHPGDGRLRQDLLFLHVGAHLHRRRRRVGACAPACRCRTWSSCSFIRPASMGQDA